MNAKQLKRLLETPWCPETLTTRETYVRTQDDCDGIPTKGQLSVTFTEDGDAWLMAMDSETHSMVSMRFRTMIGGGISLRTQQAIVFLAEAMRLDELEYPQTEWRAKKMREIHNGD